MVKRHGLGELSPTTMTLQMANWTMAQPEGVLENVLIKVEKFIFHMDFVIMDMEEDTQVPLLHGRPFLATRAVLIDVKKGEITLRVREEAGHFKLNTSLKQSEFEIPDCKTIDTIVPINPELMFGCNFQNTINENEMNFQYLDDLGCEFLHSSCELKELVFSMNENSIVKTCNNEEEAKETKTY